MAANDTLGLNVEFPIYVDQNNVKTRFHNLVLHKSTVESVVMSLGDKVTGDVYYKDNELDVSMQEYIEVDGVRYILVNPPTIVREGMVSDNSQPKGMTKYSFVFYHPMCQLGNFPFADVAVSADETKYLSENKTFSWIGHLPDYVAKLNKNLEGTQWVVTISPSVPQETLTKLSEVLPFDKNTIADALKTGYDTWEVPYIIDSVATTESYYSQGKRFKVIFGLPSNEIYENDSQRQLNNPFVFQFGQGVGLKNNSRTPRNNKIITRITGSGSERNIPYGYPQIPWYGDMSASFTYGNAAGVYTNVTIGGRTFPKVVSYPIYEGIVGGRYVKLIKHPFTRTTLMPSVYSQAVFNKVSPYIQNTTQTEGSQPIYDQEFNELLLIIDGHIANCEDNTEKAAFTALKNALWDIVDEDSSGGTISRTIHGSGYDITIRMNADRVVDGVLTWNAESDNGVKEFEFAASATIVGYATPNPDYDPDATLIDYYDAITSEQYPYPNPIVPTAPSYENHQFEDIYPELGQNISLIDAYPINDSDLQRADAWDDTIDDDGNYKQGYFKVKLPVLSFDLYACAAITEEMQINMRSGACLGCTFTVQVDWEDYKNNFYDTDGSFVPYGTQRDLNKYPNSSTTQIELILQKDTQTFGTLMPNVYQNPKGETSQGAGNGDTFVVLGISLPLSYITNAEQRLDDEMKSYMLENNVHYFDYPLKFDEFFLRNNRNILSQIKPNTVIRFKYGQENLQLFVKQLVVKYGDKPLPQYDITLTDNVEVVLNSIGQVADDVEKLSSLISILRQSYSRNVWNELAKKLSKTQDDTAQGFIRFLKGLQVGQQFVTGLLGEGGVFRKEADGTTYLEADKMYIRMKAYFDSVEIREYQHSAGNRVASVAGNKCVRVAWFNSSNVELEQTQANLASVAYFRCYFRASDGEDTVRNNFVIGDQVYCHITSVNGSTDNPNEKGLNQKHYWRLCIGRNVEGTLTDDGEAWIDVSNRSSETLTISGTSYTHAGYQTGSDIPEPQDSMIQLGNINDVARQGAIIEFVTGANAPSYQIYQGINDFSLNNKNQVALGYDTSTGRAYMNVFGDFRFGSSDDSGSYIKYNAGNGQLDIKARINAQSTIGSQSLPDYIKDNQNNYNDAWVHTAVEDLQSQIDGEIDSWFYNYLPVASLDSKVPLTNKEPYKTWYEADGGGTASEETTERTKHLGDTFYDNSSGYAFRFSLNESTSAFEWNLITDSAVVQALANAAKAQETADGKRATFSTWNAWVKNGVNTLKQGDLFIPTTDTTQGSTTYKAKKVYKCTTDATNAFEEVAYTDDSAFNGYINAIINGSGSSGDAAVAAAAQRAITSALGGATVVDGGLLLTSLIAMRKYNGSGSVTDVANYTTWAGISGTYHDAEIGTGYKGHGIAAWYGGAMTDGEVSGWTGAAKSLFRFDGSGYLAGGNITWDKNGIVTIANVYSDVNGTPVPWSGNTLQYMTNLSSLLPIRVENSVTYLDPQVSFWNLSIKGKAVATQEWVGQNYLSIAYFNHLFQAYSNADHADAHKILPNDVQTTVNNLKILVGAWTDQYLSALGLNPDSSGGGGGATNLDDLVDVTITSPQENDLLIRGSGGQWINTSKSSFLSGYATQSWVQSQGYLTSLYSLTLKSKQGNTTSTVTTFSPTSAAAELTLVAGTNITIAPNATNHTIEIVNSYSLPLAASGTRGGVQIGYSESNSGSDSSRNYAVKLSSEKMYVNVPWTDTVYTLPTASSSTKGGVKVGSTLSISSEILNLASITVGTPASGDTKYTKVVVDSYGRVTKATTLSASDIPDISSTYATSSRVTTLEGYFTSGVANSAAKLTTVSKTLWGNTYWTSGGVPTDIGTSALPAALSYVSSITFADTAADSIRTLLSAKMASNDFFRILVGGSADAGYVEIATADGKNEPIYVRQYGSGAWTSTNIRTLTLLDSSGNTSIPANLSIGEDLTFTGAYSVVSFGNGDGATISGDLDDGSSTLTLYADKIELSGNTALYGTLGVTGLLTASGNIATNSYIKIGSVYLVYDSTHNAICVSSNTSMTGTAHLYATGGVSALGYGDSGSGGGTDMNTVWSALGNYDGVSSHYIDYRYIGVQNAGVTLDWNTAKTIATIGSNGSTIGITVKMPANPNTDTKNTAGGDNSTNKLFLVGIETQQTTNNGTARTYTNSNVYATNGALHASTYNALTLTAAATGFTIAGGTTSKTLTVGESYTLGAACAKGVVTSIDTSASLPTSNAVKTFVEGKGYTTNTGTVTSITLKAGTGISLDVDNTAITTSGTRTITNAGVRAVSINGDYLRVNTNGTNADLTIPYAGYTNILRSVNMASGDDYDTLSGYSYARGCFVALNFNNFTTSDVTLDDLGLYDTLVSFGYGNRTIQFKGAAYSDALKYRHVRTVPNSNPTQYDLCPWKTIAFTDSNVASATKLQTSRTIWGRPFDGTANVTGSLQDVDEVRHNNNTAVSFKDTGGTVRAALSFNDSNQFNIAYGMAAAGYDTYINGYNIYLKYGDGHSHGLILNSSGNVGIGTVSPAYKLDVNGTMHVGTTSYLQGNVGISTAPDTGTTYKLKVGGRMSVDGDIYLTGTSKEVNFDGSFISGYEDGSDNTLELNTTKLLLTADLTTVTGNLVVGDNVGDGSYIQIGDIRIGYDSKNNALKVYKVSNGSVVAANFYATGGVSALGASTITGGGGGGIDEAQMWSVLARNTSEQINASHLSTALSGYLPLTGGTLTGNVTFDNERVSRYKITRAKSDGGGWAVSPINIIDNSSSLLCNIGVLGNNDVLNYMYLGVDEYNGTNNLRIYPTYAAWGTNTIWHAGNDGSGSGLDADLLDGQHGSYYMKRGSAQSTSTNSTLYYKVATASFDTGAASTHDTAIALAVTSYYGYGNGILTASFRKDANTSVDTNQTYLRWVCRDKEIPSDKFILTYKVTDSGAKSTINLYIKLTAGWQDYRISMLDEGGWYSFESKWTLYNVGASAAVPAIPSDETQVACTDNTMAGKLSTSCTLWGRPFDGTANVSGALSSVTSIEMSSALYIANANSILFKDSGGTYRTTFGVDSSNNLAIGYGMASAGYNTFIDGNTLSLCYGKSHTTGIYLNASGNVGIGTTSPTSKLDVNGTVNTKGVNAHGLIQIFGNRTVNSETYEHDLVIHNNIAYTTDTSTEAATARDAKSFAYYAYEGGTNRIGYNPLVFGASSAGNTGALCWTGNKDYTGTTNSYYWGINTWNPLYQLEVGGTFGAKTMTITSTTEEGHLVFNRGAYNYIRCSATSGSIGFIVNGQAVSQSNYALFINSNGNIGIGSYQPSYKLHVAGTGYFSNTLTLANNISLTLVDTNSVAKRAVFLDTDNNFVLGYDMRSSNNAVMYGNNIHFRIGDNNRLTVTNAFVRSTVGFYSDSYVSALGQNTSSDIRMKDVRGNVMLRIKDIADAPSVKYLWKDRHDMGMQAGSIAQYWQRVLPETVHEGADGMLSMEYGVIALLASIATARKVRDHEERILELERENRELKEEVERLKTA